MDQIKDVTPATYTVKGVERKLATTGVKGQHIQYLLSFFITTSWEDFEYFLSDPALSTINTEAERKVYTTTNKLVSATLSEKPLRNHAFAAICLIGELSAQEVVSAIGMAVSTITGTFNVSRGALADLSSQPFCGALQAAQAVLLQDYLAQTGTRLLLEAGHAEDYVY